MVQLECSTHPLRTRPCPPGVGVRDPVPVLELLQRHRNRLRSLKVWLKADGQVDRLLHAQEDDQAARIVEEKQQQIKRLQRQGDHYAARARCMSSSIGTMTASEPSWSNSSARPTHSAPALVPQALVCGIRYRCWSSSSGVATTSNPSRSGSRLMARSTISSMHRTTIRPHTSLRRSNNRSSTPSSLRARRSFSRRVSTLYSTCCPRTNDTTRTSMRIQRRRPNSSSRRLGSFVLEWSKIGDDFSLTGCSFSRDASMLTTRMAGDAYDGANIISLRENINREQHMNRGN
ncbi:hypothetical protein ZEAMMB73_Zm00001d029219, partial [Zea mays]